MRDETDNWDPSGKRLCANVAGRFVMMTRNFRTQTPGANRRGLTRGGLVAVRSSVSSAQNEHFVPIEDLRFVRDPSLTPPLPWLALLPDP